MKKEKEEGLLKKYSASIGGRSAEDVVNNTLVPSVLE